MSSVSNSGKRLFGNCKVEWQISNFLLQTCTKDWFIQSPEFTVNGSEETKWCFYLRPKQINGCSFALFNIKRSSIDSGAKYEWLNVKIHCKISDSKSICFEDKLLPLKNGWKHKISLGSTEYLLSQINQSEDLLRIVCHMIVYSKSKSGQFRECDHEGIKLLSKNMLDLYTSSQNFDTKLLVGSSVILAHKDILCARNEYLDCIIDDDDEEDDDDNLYEYPEYTVIDFSDYTCDSLINYNGMRRVLAYLYTGDMRHVLQEPSFAIQYCASFLEINDVKFHYEPDNLVLKSSVDLEEHSYIIHGYEFSESFLIWECYTKESVTTFQLLLYPEGCNNKVNRCIQLFHKNSHQSMIAQLKFDLIFENCTKSMTYVVNIKGDVIDDEKVYKLFRTLDCGQNIFDVKINVKLSRGIKISDIDEPSSVFVNCIDEDYYYHCLSRDLEFLLDGGRFTDTVIDNNGTYFWVHKCILASRCRLFSDILEANEEGEAIILSNFDPHTISAILTYLYSGILIGTLDDDIIQVYKAAAWSKLFQLQSLCADWLKTSFKNDRSIRCRIVRIAEEYQDSHLMKSVLNDSFFRKEIFLIPNNISFQDVHACRFCLMEH